MRVTLGVEKALAIKTMRDNLDEYASLQKKFATGEEVHLPSDDPLRYVRARRFESDVRRSERMVSNIEDAMRFMDDSEAAARTIVDQLQRVRALVVRLGNDHYTTSDLQVMSPEINQLLEGLVQFANSEHEDGYIFGGAETETEPFGIFRDSNGEINRVVYQGDDVAIEREFEEEGRVQVNMIGSRVFQAAPDTVTSGYSNDNAGETLNGASNPLNDTPASGWFEVQGERVYYDLTRDSLLDLAARINSSAPNVTADVTGNLTGTISVTDPDAALPPPPPPPLPALIPGDVSVNNVTVSFAAGESLNSVAAKLNAVSDQTGVTASVVPSGTGYALSLSGGVEVDDGAPGASNIFQLLGVTNGGSSPSNLLSSSPPAYSLRITANDADQVFLSDEADGRLLQRLSIIDGMNPAPGNISSAATENDRSIFNILMDLRRDLNNGDSAAVRNNYLNDLDRGIDSILGIAAEFGARRRRAEDVRERHESMQVEMKRLISVEKDLDYSEAITDLKKVELKLQTAAGSGKNLPIEGLLAFL